MYLFYSFIHELVILKDECISPSLFIVNTLTNQTYQYEYNRMKQVGDYFRKALTVLYYDWFDM